MPLSGRDLPSTAQREIVSLWTKAVYSTFSMSLWTYCFTAGDTAHMENTKLHKRMPPNPLMRTLIHSTLGNRRIQHRKIASPWLKRRCATTKSLAWILAPIQRFLNTSNSNKTNSEENLFFFQSLLPSNNLNTAPFLSWVTRFIQFKSHQTKIKSGLRKTKLFTPLFPGMTS